MAVVAIACGKSATPTAPTPGIPATASDLKSSLSNSFDAMAIPGTAACSISISQFGEVLLERGRGQIGPGLQATGDSLYRIASLTKPITASAVLISEQAGRLSRTDKINRFLAFPEPAPTVDELIKHIPGSMPRAASHRPPPI
jgi:CubicO group peptidase (beta-lactamase class C family)